MKNAQGPQLVSLRILGSASFGGKWRQDPRFLTEDMWLQEAPPHFLHLGGKKKTQTFFCICILPFQHLSRKGTKGPAMVFSQETSLNRSTISFLLPCGSSRWKPGRTPPDFFFLSFSKGITGSSFTNKNSVLDCRRAG